MRFTAIVYVLFALWVAPQPPAQQSPAAVAVVDAVSAHSDAELPLFSSGAI